MIIHLLRYHPIYLNLFSIFLQYVGEVVDFWGILTCFDGSLKFLSESPLWWRATFDNSNLKSMDLGVLEIYPTNHLQGSDVSTIRSSSLMMGVVMAQFCMLITWKPTYPHSNLGNLPSRLKIVVKSDKCSYWVNTVY